MPLQVKALVMLGRARFDLKDHFGSTALDEARRVGANEIVSYLLSIPKEHYMVRCRLLSVGRGCEAEAKHPLRMGA